MPIPKLVTTKGVKMDAWNLTTSQLSKAQAAFREVIPPSFDLEAPAQPKAAKKGAKKAAKKRSPRVMAAPEAFGSSLTIIKPKDLIISKEWWKKLVLVVQNRKRKNQKDLTATEWNAYIDAIEAIAAPGAASPTFQEIVGVHIQAMDPNNHAAHGWGVHTMGSHNGRNFLAWHREYLAKLEARLMLVNPLVTIPYWNWVVDRAVPPQLSSPSDLAAWGVTRGTLDPNDLPVKSDVNLVMSKNSFNSFQKALEDGPHNWVHNAVSGTMAMSASPADPLFWLHHAYVDKLWADWQKTHTGAKHKPSNQTETLKPPPIITRKVSQVINTTSLGYSYV
jgi:tyrosinase